MSSNLKLSIQGLNLLFSQLADSESKVVWVRSPDYEKQIYVGENYEKIWGRKCEQLYEHPLSWGETLATEETEQVIQELKIRPDQGSVRDKTGYYIVRHTDGHLVYVKDSCFHLFDQDGLVIAVAGIGEVITQNQWEKEVKQDEKNDQNKTDLVRKDFGNIAWQELKLTMDKPEQSKEKPLDINTIRFVHTAAGESIKLTPREAECLFYLSSGHSAKMIGRLISISPRTVEVYIENVKKKLDCRTRVQLISKLRGFGEVA